MWYVEHFANPPRRSKSYFFCDAIDHSLSLFILAGKTTDQATIPLGWPVVWAVAVGSQEPPLLAIRFPRRQTGLTLFIKGLRPHGRATLIGKGQHLDQVLDFAPLDAQSIANHHYLRGLNPPIVDMHLAAMRMVRPGIWLISFSLPAWVPSA